MDENLRRAHLRNAAVTEKFFFRKHMAPPPDTGKGETSNTISHPLSPSSGKDGNLPFTEEVRIKHI